MDHLFNAVSSNLEKFHGRASLIKERAWFAVDRFLDQSFDLVYIDGGLTYEGTVKDLAAWYRKVIRGGIICGDDIGLFGVKKPLMSFL
jgi:predicted O-methyltransferase YrrM